MSAALKIALVWALASLFVGALVLYLRYYAAQAADATARGQARRTARLLLISLVAFTVIMLFAILLVALAAAL